jgi:hypothetical protein
LAAPRDFTVDMQRQVSSVTSAVAADTRAAAKVPLYVQRLFEVVSTLIHPTDTVSKQTHR